MLANVIKSKVSHRTRLSNIRYQNVVSNMLNMHKVDGVPMPCNFDACSVAKEIITMFRNITEKKTFIVLFFYVGIVCS